MLGSNPGQLRLATLADRRSNHSARSGWDLWVASCVSFKTVSLLRLYYDFEHFDFFPREANCVLYSSFSSFVSFTECTTLVFRVKTFNFKIKINPGWIFSNFLFISRHKKWKPALCSSWRRPTLTQKLKLESSLWRWDIFIVSFTFTFC